MNNSNQELCCVRLKKFQKNDWARKKIDIVSHNIRLSVTPNADSTVSNRILYGPNDNRVIDACDELIATHKHPKNHRLRSNAVVAIEVLLTVSPEFFLDSSNMRQSQKVDRWATTSQNWLKETFGKNLAHSTLHLDEMTPHIHAICIPLLDGVLSSSKLYGDKESLRDLQTSYANALRPLGIERGMFRSKAKHHDISAYYNRVNRALDYDLPVLVDTASIPQPTLAQLADPHRYVMQTLESELTKANVLFNEKMKTVVAKAIEYDALSKDYKRLQKEANSYRASFSDIALTKILQKVGYYAKSPYKNGKRYTTAIGEIFIRGLNWRNIKSDISGKGAITFVMHLLTCDEDRACSWLKSNFSDEQAAQSLNLHLRRKAHQRVRSLDEYIYVPPQRNADQSNLTIRLELLLGLTPTRAQEIIDLANLYISSSDEIVVPRLIDNICYGAEIATNYAETCRLDLGSSLNGPYSIYEGSLDDRSTKLAICSSAISAICYQQLFNVSTVSCAGALGEPVSATFLELISQQILAGRHITIALDQDSYDISTANRLKIAILALVGESYADAIEIQQVRQLGDSNEYICSTWLEVLTVNNQQEKLVNGDLNGAPPDKSEQISNRATAVNAQEKTSSLLDLDIT